MSWSVSTKSTDFKHNQKYNQKYTSQKYKNPDIKVKGRTNYIPLVPRDALYRENLFLLSNPQFQEALLKVLKDLNTLLYYSQNDFFQELETCDSLRVCLQSCLVCLCKNSCYNLCSTKILQQNEEKINFPNNFFILYEKLNQVVLKIYFRIVHAQSLQHKQIIYNSWLLDIPKMVDLCMIYCLRTDTSDNFTNVNLVQEIVSKAILSNPKDYSRDFDDFVNILYQDKLSLIHKDIKFLINLSPEAMEKASTNFANPLRSFLITSNKILFEVKDLFVLISYVYRCFPKQLSEKLATDHEILEDTIRIFIEFVQNTPLWKTEPYQKQFNTNFQDIHRTACQCYLLNFRLLRKIIEQGDTLTNDYFSRAMISYSVHCMYLVSDKVNKDYQNIYQRMITTIINQFEAKELFFLREAPSKLNFVKLSEDEKRCIQKSFAFVEKIETKLTEEKQDNSVQIRIKEKIDNFFRIAEKPKQQNRIFYQNMNPGLQKKNKNSGLHKKQKKQQKTQNEFDWEQNLSQLDFSALVLEETDQENDQKLQELDLSFEELKSQKQHENEQKIQKYTEQLLREQTFQDPTSPEILEKRYLLEQEQKKIYHRSLIIQDEDQSEELEAQQNTYYHHNKPQFGLFTDRLIQREEWIHHSQ